jgi:hypothetical protein
MTPEHFPLSIAGPVITRLPEELEHVRRALMTLPPPWISQARPHPASCGQSDLTKIPDLHDLPTMFTRPVPETWGSISPSLMLQSLEQVSSQPTLIAKQPSLSGHATSIPPFSALIASLPPHAVGHWQQDSLAVKLNEPMNQVHVFAVASYNSIVLQSRGTTQLADSKINADSERKEKKKPNNWGYAPEKLIGLSATALQALEQKNQLDMEIVRCFNLSTLQFETIGSAKIFFLNILKILSTAFRKIQNETLVLSGKEQSELIDLINGLRKIHQSIRKSRTVERRKYHTWFLAVAIRQFIENPVLILKFKSDGHFVNKDDYRLFRGKAAFRVLHCYAASGKACTGADMAEIFEGHSDDSLRVSAMLKYVKQKITDDDIRKD